eukprot:c27412_g1_i1 orf=385-705(+)
MALHFDLLTIYNSLHKVLALPCNSASQTLMPKVNIVSTAVGQLDGVPARRVISDKTEQSFALTTAGTTILVLGRKRRSQGRKLLLAPSKMRQQGGVADEEREAVAR